MSSSSVISTSDSSSSNEGTSAHMQVEMSHSPRDPPRQLCQCTKCVGQISHKSYVCAQHIQRFGRHRGLTPGASSSHVGSCMTPPPYVLSQGVLFAIGNALSQAFDVGISSSHEANKPHHEARPCVPSVRHRSKAQRPSEGHARTIVEGRWGMCEFTGKCANIIQSWNPAVLGLLDSLPYDEEVVVWGRRWIVKTSTLGERHGYGKYACEDIIVEDLASCRREGPTLFPYGGPIYKRRHWNMILTQHPEWKTFALEMDTFAGSTRRHSDGRVIDRDPIRSGKIVGFMNSTVGTQPKCKANCVSQPVQEAPLPANQEQAMDDFMVDWFGLDIVDDMSSNPHDEGANADDPHHQHTAQGQQQWQEAEAHVQTPIFQGARLSRLVAIVGLLNIQAKHKASNTMLSDIF
ncbi:unnamed protein product [Sphagnum jensenii]|uniref:Transposase n=1 Tax=Sphagnum jensenii TaxID=128206 RepID=A0ABP0VHU5_9BRYO